MGQRGPVGVWGAAWDQGHRGILTACGTAGFNGWQGLGGAEGSGEHLLCASVGSSMHPMRGWMCLSPPGNLSLCYLQLHRHTSLLLLKLPWCRILPEEEWTLQVHLHPSHLISSFFTSLGWRNLGKHSLIYSASLGSCCCWRLPLAPLYPVEKTHEPLRSPLGCTKDTPVLVCIQGLFVCCTGSFLTSLVSWELLFTS